MAFNFPLNPTDGQESTQGASNYMFNGTLNRWEVVGGAGGGASVVVSITRPDPADGNEGDLWWYCGVDGDDSRLYTLVIDQSDVRAWIEASPGIAFEGSGGGGVTVAEAPPQVGNTGGLWYRIIGESARTSESLYIDLGDRWRGVATTLEANFDDIIVSVVSTFPDITGFPASPTMTFTSGTGTVDISALADDDWVIAYLVGGGGGGASFAGTGTVVGAAGGGGGAAIKAYPKVLLGDTLTYTVGTRGSGGSILGGVATSSTLTSTIPGNEWTGGAGGRAIVSGGTPFMGTGGVGEFLWPDADGVIETDNGQAPGTSAGIPDITNNLRGITGSHPTDVSNTWGGGSGGSSSSTYAGTAGRGGSAGSSGTAGFVRIWFPR